MINSISKENKCNVELYNDDCLKILPNIKSKSIDLILCDLPYGVTRNKWDNIIPMEELWLEYKRVIKPKGIIVLTATQVFSSMLVMSNLDMFKYDIIWEKTLASNQLNVKHQPLRNHEHILIFYKSKGTYNEQLTEGTPYSINRKAEYKEHNYNDQKPSCKVNTGYRHAKSVIKIPNPRIKDGHPNQKPAELLDYLIKAYSNEGDIVLDNCMGSGSTGVSAVKLNRYFIGIEMDINYYEKAVNCINNTLEDKQL